MGLGLAPAIRRFWTASGTSPAWGRYVGVNFLVAGNLPGMRQIPLQVEHPHYPNWGQRNSFCSSGLQKANDRLKEQGGAWSASLGQMTLTFRFLQRPVALPCVRLTVVEGGCVEIGAR